MKTLKAKLILSLIVMWLGLLALAAWSAFSTRQTMLNERRDGLKRVVETADGILQSYAKEAASGSISLEEAKRKALEGISVSLGVNGSRALVERLVG